MEITAAQRPQVVDAGPDVQVLAVERAGTGDGGLAAPTVRCRERQAHAAGEAAARAAAALVQVQAQGDVREQHTEQEVLKAALIHAHTAVDARRLKRARGIGLEGDAPVEAAVGHGHQAPERPQGAVPAHPGRKPSAHVGGGDAVRSETQGQPHGDVRRVAAQGPEARLRHFQPRGEGAAAVGRWLYAAGEGKGQRRQRAAGQAQAGNAQAEAPRGPRRAAAEVGGEFHRALGQGGNQRAPGLELKPGNAQAKVEPVGGQPAAGADAA